MFITTQLRLTTYYYVVLSSPPIYYTGFSQKKISFPVFFSKHVCIKTKQSTDKPSKHNDCTLFLRISTGDVNFVFYPLSSFNFISSLFPTNSLFDSATATVTAGLRPPHPTPGRNNKDQDRFPP